MRSSCFADSGIPALAHPVRQRVAAISGHFLRWIIVNALLK